MSKAAIEELLRPAAIGDNEFPSSCKQEQSSSMWAFIIINDAVTHDLLLKPDLQGVGGGVFLVRSSGGGVVITHPV